MNQLDFLRQLDIRMLPSFLAQGVIIKYALEPTKVQFTRALDWWERTPAGWMRRDPFNVLEIHYDQPERDDG